MSSLDLETDTNLNLTFPLPYRVLTLLGIGILAWATNLHGLHLLGIDAVGALELRTEGHVPRTPSFAGRPNGYSRHAPPSAFYFPAYKIFFAYTGFCFASWTVFRFCTRGDRLLVDAFGYIPLITGLVILIILVCPMNVLLKHERDKFLYALYRCLFSRSNAPVQFSDVVFADIATSFAKVLGDIWLSLAMLLPGNSVLVAPSEEGWHKWVLPAIMSFPYLVRFRQCMIEFCLPSNSSQRPLLNAIKYATAFPVIFLSAAQKSVPIIDSAGRDISSQAWNGTFRLWLLAAAINSCYSFWWDITNDWGLEMLKGQKEANESGHRTPPRRLVLPQVHSHSNAPLLTRTSFESAPSERHRYSPVLSRATSPHQQPYPWGLRTVLLYPLPVYPLLVFLNLILRMTWSIKLSSHLYSVSDGSMGIFSLEVAEIVRRWLWVFLRVEWEVTKKIQDGLPKARPDDFSSENEYEMVPAMPEEHFPLRS